jgi:hypothetical protein
LDCKGKNYFSNKKEKDRFLAQGSLQKPVFAKKRPQKSSKSAIFNVK